MKVKGWTPPPPIILMGPELSPSLLLTQLLQLRDSAMVGWWTFGCVSITTDLKYAAE